MCSWTTHSCIVARSAIIETARTFRLCAMCPWAAHSCVVAQSAIIETANVYFFSVTASFFREPPKPVYFSYNTLRAAVEAKEKQTYTRIPVCLQI